MFHFFKRIPAAVLAGMLAFSGVAAAQATAPECTETVVVIAAVEPGVRAEQVLSAVPGASLLREYSLIDGFAAEIPADRIDDLARQDGVTEVSRSATFLAPQAELTGSVDPSLIVSTDEVIRAGNDTAGEGTLIAVLDSGFDVTHPVFVLPEGVQAVLTEENLPQAAEGTLAYLRTGRSTEKLYVSAKIPFAFDYDGMDTDVSCSSAHGTHVAATAAGSDAGEGALSGTAPGAQLLLMKVFDDRGKNCSEYALICAVEDAVQLGADVINLSLGSLAYSGGAYSMGQFSRALAAAEEAGVLIVCAAGNDGRAGALGVSSDLPRAADPDYGLPSEPAVMSEALAVGAAANAVVYTEYMECAGNFIFYDETYEASAGEAETLSDVLGGRTLTLRVIPGVGRPEDYEGIDADGAAVLVRRGEITFADKVENAADAGAAAVIVYDPDGLEESFLMSIGGKPAIPAVSVSRENGELLSSLDGEKITFAGVAEAFASADSGVASYSSYGPTADLLLKPEIAAVGSSVISAVPGGYGVMTGTSMAAPQIAGMAARALSEHRGWAETLSAEERAFRWKAYLMSAAQPLTDESGLPLSPRGQGAGILKTTNASVLMETAEGTHAIHAGDHAEGGFSFDILLTNLTDREQTLTLHASMLTDAAAQAEDGIWYITGESERVPASITAAGSGVRYTGGNLTVTLPPSAEAVTLRITLAPDESYVQEKYTVFENGFYLEGYVQLKTADGTHAASLPYLSFAGDWNAAPMIDAADWDGSESYYGVNLLLRETRDGTAVAGESPAGVFSALFSFSPDGDGDGDQVFLESAPLRNIAELHIEILSAEGEVLYTGGEFDLLKSLASEGSLVYNTLYIWDGSDGINDHFHWADGLYTVRLTLISYTGGTQILSFPLRIDTAAPEVHAQVGADGTLTVTGTDDHALSELRVYLPGEDGEYVTDESVRPENGEAQAALTAAYPAGAEYVYISAEDYAGNKTVIRCYP